MLMRPARLLGLVLAILLPGLALAHGDAAWIQHEPRYLMRGDNRHCCDVSHCHRGPPPGGVAIRDEGIEVLGSGQVFAWGQQGLYASIDDEWWWCGMDGYPGDARDAAGIVNVWCLFQRPPGT